MTLYISTEKLQSPVDDIGVIEERSAKAFSDIQNAIVKPTREVDLRGTLREYGVNPESYTSAGLLEISVDPEGTAIIVVQFLSATRAAEHFGFRVGQDGAILSVNSVSWKGARGWPANRESGPR
jgi:hypothetical protein